MPLTAHRWRRFQQKSGWPFGPVATAAWVVGAPLAITVIMAILDGGIP